MAHLRVRLSICDLLSAQQHVALSGEVILDPLCGVLQLLVGASLEVRHDVRQSPIARDHRGVMGLVEAQHARHIRLAAKLGGDLLDTPSHGWPANVARVYDRHDARVDLAAGRRLEPIGRLNRLRRRVVSSVGTHVLGRAEAKCAGDDRAEKRDQQHRASVGMKEGGESREHWRTPVWSQRRGLHDPRVVLQNSRGAFRCRLLDASDPTRLTCATQVTAAMLPPC